MGPKDCPYFLQAPSSIITQVQMHPRIPVHTISFNCSDREANQFLHDLARDTGGRFHYWSETGTALDGPAPWQVGTNLQVGWVWW